MNRLTFHKFVSCYTIKRQEERRTRTQMLYILNLHDGELRCKLYNYLQTSILQRISNRFNKKKHLPNNKKQRKFAPKY